MPPKFTTPKCVFLGDEGEIEDGVYNFTELSWAYGEMKVEVTYGRAKRIWG